MKAASDNDTHTTARYVIYTWHTLSIGDIRCARWCADTQEVNRFVKKICSDDSYVYHGTAVPE